MNNYLESSFDQDSMSPETAKGKGTMDSILKLISQPQHNEHKGRDRHMKELRCLLFCAYFFFNSSCLAALLDHSFGKKAYLPDEKWANSDPIDGPHASSVMSPWVSPCTRNPTKLISWTEKEEKRKSRKVSQVCLLRCKRYLRTSRVTFHPDHTKDGV